MNKASSHPVDVHVGRRLRSRRTIMGMSQEELGEAVHITFQQIQKYERGFNRIGSSRLYEFARILDIDVAYFFDDYDVDLTLNPRRDLLVSDPSVLDVSTLNNKEILSLIKAFYGIGDEQVRKKVLSLIKTLSEDYEEDVKPSSKRRVQAEAERQKVQPA